MKDTFKKQVLYLVAFTGLVKLCGRSAQHGFFRVFTTPIQSTWEALKKVSFIFGRFYQFGKTLCNTFRKMVVITQIILILTKLTNPQYYDEKYCARYNLRSPFLMTYFVKKVHWRWYLTTFFTSTFFTSFYVWKFGLFYQC